MAGLKVRAPSKVQLREIAIRAASVRGRSGIVRASRLTDDTLRRRALDSDFVSFDIFDTAIVRAVAAPDALFLFLGDPPSEFRRSRLDAESTARSAAANRGLDEVSIEEIHRCAAWPRLRNVDTSDVMASELELELAFCRAHAPALELFDELKAAGRAPAFISDTYLSRDTIIELLCSCGFAGWSELVVSSDHGRTKRSGELFDIAAKQLGVPTGWMHLGDTLIPDVINARRRGIRVGYVPRPIDQLRLAAPRLSGWVESTASPAGASVLLGLLANTFAASPTASRSTEALNGLISRVAALLLSGSDQGSPAGTASNIVRDFCILSGATTGDQHRIADALEAYLVAKD